MLSRIIMLIASFLLFGCVSSSIVPSKQLERPKPQVNISTKVLTIKLDIGKTTQKETITLLGAPTNISSYDANLYGENMDVSERHIGKRYEYNSCDMSQAEKVKIVIKTLVVDENAPDLEYIVKCNTTRKILSLSFFDGKLSQYSYSWGFFDFIKLNFYVFSLNLIDNTKSFYWFGDFPIDVQLFDIYIERFLIYHKLWDNTSHL